jgi:hypothetical protein
MKNKIISLFLVVVSLILLCGCKKSEDPANAVIKKYLTQLANSCPPNKLKSGVFKNVFIKIIGTSPKTSFNTCAHQTAFVSNFVNRVSISNDKISPKMHPNILYPLESPLWKLCKSTSAGKW